jgi:N-acetylated-alpha-linked acidic dipeptidase
MRLRALTSLLLIATSSAGSFTFAQNAPAPHLLGFTSSHAEAELEFERQFKSAISPDSEKTFHRWFTRTAHPAGTIHDKEVADYIAKTWRDQGLEDVVIRQYDVLGSLPKEIVVEMIAPVPYKAGLREAGYDVDPDTKNPEVRGAWTSMSASGEITAPIVYAHSGNPADYEVLKQHGIDVKGKIVLVRYSNPYSYRGFKALTAQRMGVAGMLVYSDPAEDGYKKGKVFPDGPWGPETHIQRGAITYDFIVPGDPLTPGWASVPGAKRIAKEDAQSLPKIMAVPLSWHDAKPLLEHMGGDPAPKNWQGGLPIKYHLGGVGQVHMKVTMDDSIAPYYVVEARIKGSEHPDEWVVMGNHHDAWEYGGVDPSSGTASMMEMTRSFGALLQKGQRPKRTLVFCSWDGEEVGLTGSTEWGEQFEDELKQKAVAYINVDSSTSGKDFHGSAVASLIPEMLEISDSVNDPASGTSLREAWKKTVAREKKEAKEPAPASDAEIVDVRIGSGSDHTVFLNHDGVPVVELQFDGPYGVYHSMYDDFYWMNNFGDPGYRYHTLMSQLWGTLALRLADSDILPFDFSAYASKMREFVHEVQAKPDAARNVDLSGLLTALDEFESEGKLLNGAAGKKLNSDSIDAAQLDEVNHEMMQVERNWLNPDGIPGRPWFKHTLYAARYTYAHLELPGLTEAVEAKNWEVAKQQADILEKAVKKNTQLLHEARARIWY